MKILRQMHYPEKQKLSILHHISYPQVTLWDDIKQAIQSDPSLLSKQQAAAKQNRGPYTCRHSLLFFKGRIVVPNNEALCEKNSPRYA